MGGKHKGQAQRTKNNTKASTSGRSAELLNTNIKILPDFSNVVQDDFSGLVTLNQAVNENELAINTDIQLAIKKMGKKDSTTKLKALQEFSVLVDKTDLSEVILVLPIWSKIYPTLSMDTEHRVREAVQVSHGAVVTKCGRSLAPYLKQLAPFWLMSQYDTFAPAATQAQSSLQKVFPANKLPDVISFCRLELLSAISKNILEQTPSTVTGSKSCTPEEAEAIYQRVIIASLQGFALIIKHLPAEHTTWFCEELEIILSNNKFWKLASHKNPQIRSAWYISIGCLCEIQSVWFGKKHSSKTLNILVKNLNEEDSTVAPNIWDCLLMLLAIKEVWSEKTVIDKVISDQLCNIVSQGGHGSGTKLAPILLPLLAHLPSSLKSLDFYKQFFEDIIKGMDQRSILSSKIEGTAWVTGLSECVRYVSVETEESFAIQLVPGVIRSWFYKVINLYKTQTSHHLFKQSITNLATLARFWTKQSLFDTSLRYTQLIRLFWQNLRFIFSTEMDELETSNEVIKLTTDVHIELISSLKCSTVNDKKSAKVKFSEDDNVQSNPMISTSVSSNTVDKSCDVYDKDHLLFVCEVASAYLKFAIKNNIAAPILIPLCSVLNEFDKIEIMNAIYHSVFPESDSVHLIKLYTDLWHKWLTGDSMRCQSVIDIIFICFKYLDTGDQALVFEGFNKCTPSVIEMCISKCLCHPYSSKMLVKEWLSSEIVSETLVLTCKQLIKEGDRKKATLLKMCFVEDSNGNILIGDKSSSAIINTISSALPITRSNHLDMFALFTSQLASVSIKDSAIKTKLILSMIELIATVKAGSEHLSKDTWWLVNISWQDAIQSSVWNDMEINGLIFGAEAIIKQSLQNGLFSDIDFDQIEVVTEIAADLIISLLSTKVPEQREQSLRSYFENITGINNTDNEKEWLTVYYQSIVFDIMRDHLNVPFASNDRTVESVLKNCINVFNEDLDGDILKKQLVHSLFIAKLIHSIVLHGDHKSKTFSDDECYEPDKVSWISSINVFETMKEYIMLSLHNLTILESVLSTHQSWQYFGTISNVYPKLLILQTEIISSIQNTDDHKTIALKYLQNKADLQGLYWSKALCFYSKCINEQLHSKHSKSENEEYNLPSDEYQKRIFEAVAPKSLETFEGVGFFHNLQAAVNIDRESTDPFTIVTTAGIVAIRCLLLSLMNAKKDNVILIKKDIDECFSGPFGCLTMIVNKYYTDKSIMLYERDISDVDWLSIQSNISILRYLTSAVKYYGWHLDGTLWDFIMISLTLSLKSLAISKSKWRALKWSSLCCAVFDLYSEAKIFVSSIPDRCLKSAPSDTVANLPSEWKDIYEPDISGNFLAIILHIFDEYMTITDLKLITKEAYVISHIGKAIDEHSYKFNNKAVSVDNIVNSCLRILSSTRHHSLKYTAYKLLMAAVDPLVSHDSNVLDSLSEGCEEGISLPKIALHKVESSLNNVQDLLEVILSSFKLCEDSCAFEPFTDSYSIALSYLLIWDIINKITSTASGDLKHQYSEFLKNGRYIEHLCSNLFKMLPSEVIHEKETGPVDSHLQAKFNNIMKIRYDDPITSSFISTSACSVLAKSMFGIGASSVRDWVILQDCERVIDAIVSTYISPHLNSNALLDVQQRASDLKDVQIRIHWTTNELTAVHTVEGKDFELNIKLALNNPLTKPKVCCTGVATSHTNWLTLFLSYQHGSLWEAVQMWAGSLQKKIEGSAVCYICYCRLQPTTGQLTKFVCYTCKNKFHTTCLYKWFRQSSKNTCPLCRKHF